MSDIIESVRINCQLQFGKVVYAEGTVLSGSDITKEVIEEVESGVDTVTASFKAVAPPPTPPPAPKTIKAEVKPETVTAKKKAPTQRKPRRRLAKDKK